MSATDAELFQSFCRKFVNKAVKAHFKDVIGDTDEALSLNAPRQAIKRVCLHKDDDSLILTIAKLLVWWVEARGLFDEYIYGIPSTDFEISNTYYPQVKLHFREDKYKAVDNERKPARGEISFRWRETSFTQTNITKLTNQLIAEFVKPVFFYQRGRELWTYADRTKGYYFQMTVDSETTAKRVMEKVMRLQDDVEPEWDKYLKFHQDKKNYDAVDTVRVLGEVKRKPKKRPIARVEFAYAELFIPGTSKPLVLLDRTGSKVNALVYA